MKIVKPRTFTSSERFLDEIRKEIFRSQLTYKKLAEKCDVSHATIGNFASGKTRWPRHTTLFPLLEALGKSITISDRN